MPVSPLLGKTHVFCLKVCKSRASAPLEVGWGVCRDTPGNLKLELVQNHEICFQKTTFKATFRVVAWWGPFGVRLGSQEAHFELLHAFL